MQRVLSVIVAAPDAGNLLNFFASTVAICQALAKYYLARLRGRGNGGWRKTRRFRNGSNGYNGRGHATHQ